MATVDRNELESNYMTADEVDAIQEVFEIPGVRVFRMTRSHNTALALTVAINDDDKDDIDLHYTNGMWIRNIGMSQSEEMYSTAYQAIAQVLKDKLGSIEAVIERHQAERTETVQMLERIAAAAMAKSGGEAYVVPRGK